MYRLLVGTSPGVSPLTIKGNQDSLCFVVKDCHRTGSLTILEEKIWKTIPCEHLALHTL
ncbi:MAG: hypothetical protein HXS41_09740 [Theionarchaea archaeon]|nr:hypothetical protein [Theionarchaea archaeon]MBU6999407.1 hypothetical protein [Theionarchaea archaeon]MBU7021326.1 hypothetical protein [Theionarchaea archaeon]MBU7036217.1 hypothetical protein [Theionarchaea archaeon]MBU7041923.1 hypothetical protein [Theionarchaea archaeon]